MHTKRKYLITPPHHPSLHSKQIMASRTPAASSHIAQRPSVAAKLVTSPKPTTSMAPCTVPYPSTSTIPTSTAT